MNIIKGYSDGSCSPNPGKGGWGSLIVCENDSNIYVFASNGGKLVSTNNEMELTGAIELLKLCPLNRILELYLDSKYVLGGLIKDPVKGENIVLKSGKVIYTGWLVSWLKNNWKTASGGDVKNVGLWKELISQVERHLLNGSSLKFIWVKSHKDDKYNNMVDELANEGRKNIS